MKKFLQDLIARKKAELAETEKRMKASSDVNEVRSLGETLLALRDEINDAEKQLADLENDEGEGEPAPNGTEEGASNANAGNGEGRSTKMNPKASYGQNAPQARDNGETENPRSTMEYRSAFMEFVKTGKRSAILQARATNDQNESGDLGVLLPETVVQEIIKSLEKIYGQLYSQVRKLNVKGGVKFPIGSFGATFTRIGENGAPTDRQNGGEITGSVHLVTNSVKSVLDRHFLQTCFPYLYLKPNFQRLLLKHTLKQWTTKSLTVIPTTTKWKVF